MTKNKRLIRLFKLMRAQQAPTWYLCHRADNMYLDELITQRERDDMIAHIESLLDGFSTAEGWMRNNHSDVYQSIKDQPHGWDNYRLAWIDNIIDNLKKS